MITRFAPSPTGPLHLGHAYSALLAHDMARAAGGAFLLRIEDIDQSRSRPHWEEQILDDLTWLGLTWDAPLVRQSDKMKRYAQALDTLWKTDLSYPCTCSRRDIQTALSAPQEGVPAYGPDGPIYPRICPRDVGGRPPSLSPRPLDQTLRLALSDFDHLAEASDSGPVFTFEETGRGPNGETGHITFAADRISQEIGDIVIARRDMGTSYHLSVVVDDADQAVTHVVRGADLFEATHIHVVLQRALGLPTPIYHHHRLIRDDSGKRLAKRDDARAVAKYRSDGLSPSDIRKLVGLPAK